MTNDEFEILADYFEYQYFQAYEEILKNIGKRIKEIGKMSPSDAHALQQVTAYGADIQKINDILQKESKKSQKELAKVFQDVAQDGYDFAKKFYDAQGIPQVPIAQNAQLQALLSSLWNTGKGIFENFSSTSTIGVVNRNGVFVPFQEYYVRAVDDAVILVTTGTKDFNSAISSTLKELLKSGVRVKYESGNTRELYSAVRMNVLEGCNQVYIQTQQECGRQYGADGVEISAHGLCAPDHIHIQGRQYTKEQYEKLNASLARPIGKLNCHHFAFPIVMGISPPTYSKDELKKITDLSNAIVSSGGRQMTRYEASQAMRRYEYTLRQKKAEKALFEASGDADAAAIANKRIREVSAQYKKFCSDTGLTPRSYRTRLPKVQSPM